MGRVSGERGVEVVMSNGSSAAMMLPEIVLSATALVLLAVAIVAGRQPALAPGGERRSRGSAGCVAIVGLVVALGALMRQGTIGTGMLFSGMLAPDAFWWFFRALVIVSAVVAVLLSQDAAELRFSLAGRASRHEAEYLALLMGLVLGTSLLAGAANLLMVYLALECASLMSALLVASAPGSARSGEAALKYVLMSAVASGVFLFGASLFFGITGSLDLVSAIAAPRSAIFGVAGLLMMGGFLFKIAAVPLQAWCPDVYEGAPTPITALLSVAPKAAGFAILMRASASIGDAAGWPMLLSVLAAATMTFGNLAAIPQDSVKRMLAYSSIAHAGVLLIGVACATPRGREAVIVYLMAYLLMNFGAFLVVQIVANGLGTERLEGYRGLARRGAVGTAVAVAMTVFLLSLTGVPPFAGFVGKFYLFTAAIEANLVWLAVVGIINSVISLFYYMRVVKAMFFAAPEGAHPLPAGGGGLMVLLIALAIGTVAMGLAWGWASQVAAAAAAW